MIYVFQTINSIIKIIIISFLIYSLLIFFNIEIFNYHFYDKIINGLIYKYYNNIIEVIASILIILATYFISFHNKIKRILGFITFFICNILYIIIALQNNLYPLILQNLIFQGLNLLGIYNTLNIRIFFNINQKKFLTIIFISFCIIIMYIYIYHYDIIQYFFFNITETLALIFSILAGYLITLKIYIKRIYAFYSYMIANTLYMYIAFDNFLYPFLLQSFIMLTYNINGLINLKKEMIKNN